MGVLRRAALALLASAALGALAVAPQARATGAFSMSTATTYAVDPANRRTDVTIALTFRNTTPDRPGQVSLFRSIPITLQAGASAISARDAAGSLAVTTSRSAAGTLATIGLRTPLRTNLSEALSLTYRLADGAAAGLRVRPSLIVLPVWCFGTSGSAVVQLPTGYTTQALGAVMSTSTGDGQVTLSSGSVANPAAFRVLLTAARPAAYLTVARTVALTGGTLELRVRAWEDDASWGPRTLDLAAAALPALQRAIGLESMPAGALMITEAPPAGFDPLAEPLTGTAQDVGIAFDAGGFTLIHQLAHLWLGTDVASARWIREGLASHVAAIVARSLNVPAPYDPVTRGSPGSAVAMPLDAWGAGGAPSPGASPDADAWAYAASWAFVDRLAAVAGEAGLQRAVQRAAAGVGPYEGGDTGTPGVSSPPIPAPLDSRALLDQLEQGGAPSLDAAFQATVFDAATAALLPARSDARARYNALLRAAGSWGAPRPVLDAMAGWRFGDAISEMDRDSPFLADRDALLDRAAALGLSPPARLAADWRDAGGVGQARVELSAESALVEAYAAARAQIGDPNPVEALGLLGGPRPTELLATAAGLYTSGDLAGALAAIERATNLSAGAQASGVVRISLAAAAVAVAAFLLAIAIRRVRQVLGSGVRQPPAVRPPSA